MTCFYTKVLAQQFFETLLCTPALLNQAPLSPSVQLNSTTAAGVLRTAVMGRPKDFPVIFNDLVTKHKSKSMADKEYKTYMLLARVRWLVRACTHSTCCIGVDPFLCHHRSRAWPRTQSSAMSNPQTPQPSWKKAPSNAVVV